MFLKDLGIDICTINAMKYDLELLINVDYLIIVHGTYKLHCDTIQQIVLRTLKSMGAHNIESMWLHCQRVELI
jgi:ribosomal silencing factor RsfS